MDVSGQLSASRPGHFTPRERAPGTHWIGGWVGPSAGLDAVVNWKNLSRTWVRIMVRAWDSELTGLLPKCDLYSYVSCFSNPPSKSGLVPR